MSASGRRAALVTGAAGGIGSAICERLAHMDIDVLAVDLHPDQSGPGIPHEADLTTRDGNRNAVQRTIETFGRLDVLIPNAGLQHVSPAVDFPEDKWDAMLALMLTSPFLLARYAWPHLAESGGRIVVIASVHGLVASPYKSAYVAAKHGVIGLIKSLALEGAEAGINATAVCPGFVRTPLVEAQIADQARQHGLPQERVMRDVILGPHAVKRLIEPAEVADVVAFLLGSAGSAFTGAALPMDLGWSAR